MRFELDAKTIDALHAGAEIAAGIDHEKYKVEIRPVADSVRRSLMRDLD
jgi:hypothetical protein